MSTTGAGGGGGGVGGGARAGCCHSIRIPALATLESCCQPKWVAASRTSCNGSCSYLNVLKSLARLNRQPAEWQNSSPVGCQDARMPAIHLVNHPFGMLTAHATALFLHRCGFCSSHFAWAHCCCTCCSLRTKCIEDFVVTLGESLIS